MTASLGLFHMAIGSITFAAIAVCCEAEPTIFAVVAGVNILIHIDMIEVQYVFLQLVKYFQRNSGFIVLFLCSV